MEIRTERLLIRPLNPDDTDSICSFAMDREYINMMVFFPKLSREEVSEFILSAVSESEKACPDYYEFAVMLGEKMIGIVSMYFEGHYDRGELGWLISREYRGRGFALEAARGLMELFAKEKGLRRFIAQCDSQNEASKRVIKKLGMTFVEVHGGRKNRCSDDERLEELYDTILL